MSLLQLPDGKLPDRFPYKEFLIKHNLVGSGLFELERLVELSMNLPPELVEHNLGDIEVSQDPSKVGKNTLSAAETIRQIETCGSWMILTNVERDSEYKELLNQCLAEVDPYSRPILGKMLLMEAFIFISSPNSVTPFHFDPEHNFLLQVRGSKTMSVFDRDDRDLVPETWLEDKYKQIQPRNMPFDAANQNKAREVVIRPGDGLYVPQNAPHWVKNSNNVSISFSITFRSKESERLVRLHALNGKLRQKGLSPKPVGESPLGDFTKDISYRAYLRAKRLVTGRVQ